VALTKMNQAFHRGWWNEAPWDTWNVILRQSWSALPPHPTRLNTPLRGEYDVTTPSTLVSAIAPSQPLTGQVALVTGAGSGMGRSIVIALVAAGARVALIGRRLAALEETVALIPDGAERCSLHALDVSDDEAVVRTVDEVIANCGRLDILINNAGINVPVRTVADTSVADWNYVVDVNLNGTYYFVRAALPTMRKQGRGNIINVASMAAKGASVLSGASYSASKHGVLALTHLINIEEWPHGVRSTCVMPGEVNTPILDRRPVPVATSDREKMLQADDIGDLILYLSTLPDRVLIEEVTIRPRIRRVQHG
jgi:NADP-dependent 3-hydroxy acid dehydrogenase YdfG